MAINALGTRLSIFGFFKKFYMYLIHVPFLNPLWYFSNIIFILFEFIIQSKKKRADA